jgi:hypothetical protein
MSADTANCHPANCHAGDLFDGSLLLQDSGAEMWPVDKGGGAAKLMVVWGNDLDEFDPATQVGGCV